MPRISADSVAEHVARQEAAVFDAAMRLFLERGYAEVTLADIAAEVGLARNSLYRYFPDKGHIIVRWLRRELPEQAAHAQEVLGGDGPPAQRVRRWAIDQLDYARRPEHRLIAALPEVARQLDEDTRAELADSHRELLEPLAGALADASVFEPDRAAVLELAWGLVTTAAAREAHTGEDPALRAHLLRALDALVSD